MKNRIVSSLALAAAVALGASGCSLISDQATLNEYAPSDGINVNAGQVQVRNALLIAAEETGNYNLIFTAQNNADEELDLFVTLVENGTRVEQTVPVAPGMSQFGNAAAGNEVVLVTGLTSAPGTVVDVYFQAGDSAEEQHALPVLDGTLEEYRPFVLTAADLAAADDAADAVTPELEKKS